MTRFKVKGIITVLSISTLSACVTFGQMETGLAALMGKPEQEAFSVLGYPSYKQEFNGDLVYTWYVNSTGTTFIPQTTSTYGSVGRIPIQSQSTTIQAAPVNYNCTVKMIANANGIYKSWEYNGNIGGCSGLIKRLNNYTSMDQAPRQAAVVARKKEGDEAVAKLNESMSAICKNAEHAAFYAKTPCDATEITFEHLTDNTKITAAQKVVLLKFKSALGEQQKNTIKTYRTYGDAKAKRLTDYLETKFFPDGDSNYLDLYNEKITWGDFNQRRKSLYLTLRSEESKTNAN